MKKLLTLYLILSSFVSFAQDKNLIDSLNSKLSSAKSDTARVMILYELSKAYWFCDSAKSVSYAHQCRLLSEKIEYKSGVGYYYHCLGGLQIQYGSYDDALQLYRQALKIFEEVKDMKGIAYANQGIGSAYTYQTKYEDGLPLLREALKICKEIGDKSGAADCYNNIGIMNYQTSNYSEALKNFYEALKIYEETANRNWVAITQSSIAQCYLGNGNYSEAETYSKNAYVLNRYLNNRLLTSQDLTTLGSMFNELGKYREAIHYFEQAASLCDSINYIFLKMFCIGNIGDCYMKLGEHPQALKYSFEAVEYFKKIKYMDAVAAYYETIGQVYTKQKNYKLAEKYLQEALSISQEIGSLSNCKTIYFSLTKLDSATGDFSGAFRNYKHYVEIRDSLRNEEITKKTVQQQMQYDFDKKEAATKAEQDKKDAVALKELQRQKLVRNGFVGGFAFVLVFAGVFFTQRNKIKKGKKRSDELLLNILPEEVAEELKTNGRADAKQYDEVTVMFTDFKNFTQISERLSPAELVEEIHTYFKSFDNIIGKHNIEKIKTIGDAYMCAGGLPVANTTNATDVVNAAMEIQKFMLQHLQQRKNEGKEFFEIRIGIHTGPVVAGIVGVKKFAYDIWGDTVNIASRMESSGEAGKVNISGSTYELVKDKFSFVHRGKIQAKNKGEIDMYFVETVS